MEAISIRKFSQLTPDTNDLLEFHYIIHPKDQKIWIRGRDVTRSLKYKNFSVSLNQLVLNENKTIWKELVDGYEVKNLPKNWQPHTIMINEQGFNHLLMRSNMPAGRQYVKWLCSGVLPFISKTSHNMHSNENSSSESTDSQEQSVENYDPTYVTIIDKIGHMNEIEKKYEEVQTEKDKLCQKLQKCEELCKNTYYKYIAQKIMIEHNLAVHRKSVSLARSLKNRVIPDIRQKLPNKVHMIALYIINRIPSMEFNDEKRPFHYITRSQKERIDYFDKIIAKCNTTASNMIVDDENADNVTSPEQTTVPNWCSWLKHATCYFKEFCPNAITQWIDTKYRNENPLWFGLSIKYNYIIFLTKTELREKMMISNSDDCSNFFELHDINNSDDLIMKCYTPYEKEKEVFEAIIQQALKRTQDECTMTDSLKYSINDVTDDQIQEYIDRTSEYSDSDEEEFVHEATQRMITN